MTDPSYRRHTEVIANMIPPEGRRVVDVGCGDGGLVRWFARHGAASAIGVECGEAQLARARAGEAVANAKVIEGRGEALPLADGSADIVVFFNSLHHVPVPLQADALREARRVLASGGRLYVAEPLAEGDSFELGKLVDDETEVRAAAYRAITAVEGFEPESEITYLTPVVREDFESWKQESMAISPDRKAAFETHEDRLRDLFHTLGRDHEKGRAFDQPMRVNLLRKTG